jgi:acetyltransferase-like isoleucine patch superfamily enzyme
MIQKLRIILAVFISLLPINIVRIFFYRFFLGYKIKQSRIGYLTVIAVDSFTANIARIGKFCLFIGPMTVEICNGASIGNRNEFFCGYWTKKTYNNTLKYGKHVYIGQNALITTRHYFDVAGRVFIGENTWIAGIGSQFWSHGAGVIERDIMIGARCYIGSGVRFAPGSSIGNGVLVGIGAVINKIIAGDNIVIVGAESRIVKTNYMWKDRS